MKRYIFLIAILIFCKSELNAQQFIRVGSFTNNGYIFKVVNTDDNDLLITPSIIPKLENNPERINYLDSDIVTRETSSLNGNNDFHLAIQKGLGYDKKRQAELYDNKEYIMVNAFMDPSKLDNKLLFAVIFVKSNTIFTQEEIGNLYKNLMTNFKPNLKSKNNMHHFLKRYSFFNYHVFRGEEVEQENK